MIESAPKVSIIVPMYNVEDSIERCARSLFDQTFEELEYIFINDFSIDKTVLILNEVIDECPGRKNQVTILNNIINRGVSLARNKGLDMAIGEYVLHVDSDDWIEPNMVEEMYESAVQNDADIAWSDFFIEYTNDFKKTIYRKQDIPGTPSECINGVINRVLHAGVWNKLIKRSICEEFNIRFPDEVIACEDIVFVVLFLLHANQINYIPNAYYHYLQNPHSITIIRNRETFESEIKVAILLEQLLPEAYHKNVGIFKAKTKRNILLSGLFSKNEFLHCFPESKPYLFEDLTSKLDQFIIWFALRKLFSIVRILLFIRRTKNSLRNNSNR